LWWFFSIRQGEMILLVAIKGFEMDTLYFLEREHPSM